VYRDAKSLAFMLYTFWSTAKSYHQLLG